MNLAFRRRVMSGSPGIVTPYRTKLLCHFDSLGGTGTHAKIDNALATGDNDADYSKGIFKTGLTGPRYATDGYFKDAIACDGASCVKVTDYMGDPFTPGTWNFAIAGWFKWDGQYIGGDYPTLFSQSYYYSSSYKYSGLLVEIDEDGYIQWRVSRTYQYHVVNRRTDVKMPVNEWCHIALQRYSSTGLALCLNGEVIDEAAFTSTQQLYVHASSTFRIGAGSSRASATKANADNFFSGAIDEFIIVLGSSPFVTIVDGVTTPTFTPPSKPYNEKKIASA